MENKPFVLQFDEVREDDTCLVGGKGLRLAEMAQAGLPVLPGFCVTTTAYRAFLNHNGLEQVIVAGNEAAVRAHIATAELPPAVASAILEAYDGLRGPVAVRSSATSEDSQDASFAGQYDTFLNWTECGPAGRGSGANAPWPICRNRASIHSRLIWGWWSNARDKPRRLVSSSLSIR
jgi:phosphoenolpyruvate synthase/pyruvate phosphate dikinase